MKLGYSSVVDHMFSMSNILGSVEENRREGKEGKERGRGRERRRKKASKPSFFVIYHNVWGFVTAE